MTTQFSRAFTLIEVLIVIGIIAVLAAMLYPAVSGMQERGKITQDMNNLRQLGLSTQMYLNDNDNVFFSATTIWMTQMNPKYVAAWKVFQSPFDKRASSEDSASAPVSYGLNGNAVGILGEKITNPSGFITFSPAQASGASVSFQGISTTGAPGVTITKDANNVNGPAIGGTHNRRKRIDALFGDWHAENITWTAFINDTPSSSDPGAAQRWNPSP
jgi:prepilin-type N-terminal cleavage/methylation domain-containing protein